MTQKKRSRINPALQKAMAQPMMMNFKDMSKRQRRQYVVTTLKVNEPTNRYLNEHTTNSCKIFKAAFNQMVDGTVEMNLVYLQQLADEVNNERKFREIH